jgi:hypothetical protein
MRHTRLHALRFGPALALVVLASGVAGVEAGEVQPFGLNQLVETQKALDADFLGKVEIFRSEQGHLEKALEDLQRQYSEDCVPPWRVEQDAELKLRCRDLESDATEAQAQQLEVAARVLVQHGDWSAHRARAFREVASALGRMRVSAMPEEFSNEFYRRSIPVSPALADLALGDDPAYRNLHGAMDHVQGTVEELQNRLQQTLASIGGTSPADAAQSFFAAAWQEEVLAPIYRDFAEAYEGLAKIVRVGGLSPTVGPSLPIPVAPALGSGQPRAVRDAPPPAPRRSVDSWRR